jgi:predicted phage terminase large subunit-like protein
MSAIATLQNDVESLTDFIARMTPKYAPLPEHLLPLVGVIEESRQREVFVTVSQPPRGGKTETLSHGLAWRTVYDPACLNFYATFGDGLAQQTSRRVRTMVRTAGTPLSPDAQAVHDWRTVIGGGLKATSTGGEVTGRGCNSGLMVADDLVKGREFAESKLNRDRAWDWLREDYMSRLEPGASLIVNMTRWHEDDVIGRLMNDPLGLEWIHIVIPAVIGPGGEPADERTDAGARSFWPDVYSMERLSQIRLRGEHGWWSLYQQRPFPKGGGMFKRDWFNLVDMIPKGGRVVRGWDLAASTQRDSAWTAGVKLRLVDGKVFVEDVVRRQGSPHEVEQLIIGTAEHDGRSVEQDLPQDPGQAGKSQKSYLASKLQGYIARFSPETGSKELRAEPFAAQAQAGNVFIARGPWADAYLSELESFPAGRVRDQVDATSRAYASLISRAAAGKLSFGASVITPTWMTAKDL